MSTTKTVIVTLAALMLFACVADAYEGQADNKSQNATDRQNPTLHAAPIPIKQIDAAPSQRATERQQEAELLWPKFLERVIDPVTWFTFGLLFVGFLQWWAMHRQAKLMSGSLGATKTAADAAMLSAKMARVALEVAERADLLIKEVEIDNSTHARWTSIVTVVVENSGRTRAECVTTTCLLSISGLDCTIPDCRAVVAPAVLAAGASFRVPLEPFDKWLRPTVPDLDAIFDKIGTGIAGLHLSVDINYRDAFEGTRDHHTRGEAVFRPEARGGWGEFPIRHVIAD